MPFPRQKPAEVNDARSAGFFYTQIPIHNAYASLYRIRRGSVALTRRAVSAP
jgi:hypothetical protein